MLDTIFHRIRQTLHDFAKEPLMRPCVRCGALRFTETMFHEQAWGWFCNEDEFQEWWRFNQI